MIDAPSTSSLIWLGVVLQRVRRDETPWQGCGNPERSDEVAWSELEQLGHPGYRKPCDGPVEADAIVANILREVHAWAVARALEESVWSVLLCLFIPPDDILEDLVSRNILVTDIGHLPLADRWLWRLGDAVPEAALTLALRRYLGAAWSTEQFEEVVYSFRESTWLLETLARNKASSPEKGLCALRYIDAATTESRLRIERVMCEWMRNLRSRDPSTGS